MLRETARRLQAPRYEAAASLEQAALNALRERRQDRVIETNVEFWAAVVLDFAGVPAPMMPAIFTCARTAGWSAHILEQKRLGKLVRPAALYTGPGPRKPETVKAGLNVARSRPCREFVPGSLLRRGGAFFRPARLWPNALQLTGQQVLRATRSTAWERTSGIRPLRHGRRCRRPERTIRTGVA